MSNHDLTALAMIKAAEKRVSLRIEAAKLQAESGERGKRGFAGKSIKGEPGESVKGDPGKDGKSIQGPKGNAGKSEQGKRGVPGKSIKGEKGDSVKGERGKRGFDGESIKGEKGDTGPRPAHKWDGTKITVQSADGTWGKQVDLAGKPGAIIQQRGGGGGTKVFSGIATLDFGASSNTATVVVTGIGSIKATSVVLVKMRIEDTADHIAEDLLIDPIRVEAFAILAGTGFTIYGTMGNAPANGKYNVQWALV